MLLSIDLSPCPFCLRFFLTSRYAAYENERSTKTSQSLRENGTESELISGRPSQSLMNRQPSWEIQQRRSLVFWRLGLCATQVFLSPSCFLSPFSSFRSSLSKAAQRPSFTTELKAVFMDNNQVFFSTIHRFITILSSNAAKGIETARRVFT